MMTTTVNVMRITPLRKPRLIIGGRLSKADISYLPKSSRRAK
jgi:hypothetical protein